MGWQGNASEKDLEKFAAEAEKRAAEKAAKQAAQQGKGTGKSK